MSAILRRVQDTAWRRTEDSRTRSRPEKRGDREGRSGGGQGSPFFSLKIIILFQNHNYLLKCREQCPNLMNLSCQNPVLIDRWLKY